mgnify:CR=1 FL=1
MDKLSKGAKGLLNKEEDIQINRQMDKRTNRQAEYQTNRRQINIQKD